MQGNLKVIYLSLSVVCDTLKQMTLGYPPLSYKTVNGIVIISYLNVGMREKALIGGLVISR
jgi:hypothetical protein